MSSCAEQRSTQLLPGLVGYYQFHPIELKLGPDPNSHRDVANVDRVERASEDPDAAHSLQCTKPRADFLLPLEQPQVQ